MRSERKGRRHSFIDLFAGAVLTRVQQVGVLKSQNLVSKEVVSVSVERQEGHHVVTVIVADGGIGSWVVGAERLVGPEPALEDAGEEKTGVNVSY